MPLFTPRLGPALLRGRCRVAGLPLRGGRLRGGRVALYADRLTVVGWVGLRRSRWCVMLLDIAVLQAVEGGFRIELADGSSLTVTLADAAAWGARIAEYRACLAPPG